MFDVKTATPLENLVLLQQKGGGGGGACYGGGLNENAVVRKRLQVQIALCKIST